jgi:hypothetical protein
VARLWPVHSDTQGLQAVRAGGRWNEAICAPERCAIEPVDWTRRILERVGLVSDSDDDDPVRILVHEGADCERTLTVHADRE